MVSFTMSVSRRTESLRRSSDQTPKSKHLSTLTLKYEEKIHVRSYRNSAVSGLSERRESSSKSMLWRAKVTFEGDAVTYVSREYWSKLEA